MRWKSLAILVLMGGAAVAFSAESPLSEARTALEKLVETRKVISRTRADWQADKETLEQTIKLFERELQSVDEQMSKLSTNSTQMEAERADALSLQKSSAESLDRAREFALGFEGQLARAIPQLPMPLQEILKPLLNRLPSDPANTRMTAAERMQVIVGVLNELDKFNNAVTIFSEKRKDSKGEEVAVETVYVGLGAAYFVNDAGDFSGLGSPGTKGWEWTIKPELAVPVREVIRIYRNERPAGFVVLPAAIR